MRVKTNYSEGVISICLIMAAFFLCFNLPAKAVDQPDAIAVRILPNANHDDIGTWYAKQGYTGSPQSLIVDGYDAIRDGRTVFINAANLDPTNKKIYTNIYLISYNQDSQDQTADILGQLVSHWKFNTNVSGSGTCGLSNLNCQADSDCPQDYQCSNVDGAINKGKCLLKTDKACLIDSDCPVNLFCNSLKAKAIRDVKRLGVFNQIRTATESYKAANGRYPALTSGTYVTGASMSLWPSWKETLWPQLGLSQLLVDPINSLGYCAGYDADTCWNETKRQFVNSDLTLPFGSFAFVYKTTQNGVNYNLCSTFETKQSGYNTAEGWLVSDSCSSGSGTNQAPQVVGSYLDGINGKEFDGYIKATDAEGDAISSWKLVALSDFSSWGTAPVIRDTGDPGQKKIYAAKAGTPGEYKFNLILTDSRGAVSTTALTIKIGTTGSPKIEADDLNYFMNPNVPLTYTFYVEGSDSVPSYTIKMLGDSVVDLFSNAKFTVTSVGLNKIRVDVSSSIAASNLTDNLVIPVRITATADGVSSSQDININLGVEKPTLNFQCDLSARIGQPYQVGGTSCLLGSLNSGGHTLKYVLKTNIPGLRIEENQTDGNAYLKADALTPANAMSAAVTIRATNEYGAFSEKSFDLAVNTYCGDGIKETPNSEGRGGLDNDGREDCDGLDGITTDISTSSAQQYSCSTGLNVKSPFPIIDNSQCVFASPANGGGYCGDGYCEHKVNGKIVETGCNCPQDCVATSCCGDGVVSDDEVCDPGAPARDCTGISTAQEAGLPSYCSSIPVKGTQTCKSDCSGWNDCSLSKPDIVANSSTACDSTSPEVSGYACCELTDCIHDECSCCGRYQNYGYGWLDLISLASSSGFDYKKAMSPDAGTCTVSATDPTICACGSTGCSSTPLCPAANDPKNSINNSCVIAQNRADLKDWKIFTNHTTAYYRCWK